MILVGIAMMAVAPFTSPATTRMIRSWFSASESPRPTVVGLELTTFTRMVPAPSGRATSANIRRPPGRQLEYRHLHTWVCCYHSWLLIEMRSDIFLAKVEPWVDLVYCSMSNSVLRRWEGMHWGYKLGLFLFLIGEVSSARIFAFEARRSRIVYLSN